MAYVTDLRVNGVSLAERFNTLRAEYNERAEKRRVYAETLRELKTLSKRELDDIGLSYGDIERIARETAYA